MVFQVYDIDKGIALILVLILWSKDTYIYIWITVQSFLRFTILETEQTTEIRVKKTINY